MLRLHDYYGAEVLADAPLGWWRCDEGSGTTMLDSSGHGLHGTYTAGIDLTQSAKYPAKTSAVIKPVSLGGYHGSVSPIPNSVKFLRGSAFTVEMWMYMAAGSPNQYNGGVGCQKPAAVDGWWLGSFGAALYFQLFHVSSGVIFSLGYSTALDPTFGSVYGRWLYVAGVRRSDYTTLVYANDINGVLREVNAGQLAPPDATEPTYTGSEVQVGGRYDDNSWMTNGNICEAAVYGTALSQPRILAHYNAGIYRYTDEDAGKFNPGLNNGQNKGIL